MNTKIYIMCIAMSFVDEYAASGSINLSQFRLLAKQAYEEQVEERTKPGRAKRRKVSGSKKEHTKTQKRVTRLALKETVEGKRHVVPETRQSMRDVLGVIKCSSCNEMKHKDDYERGRRTCRVCRKTRADRDTLEKFSNHVVSLARRRSGCKGEQFEVSITPEWVIHRYHELKGKCELCGDTMTHSRPTKSDKKEGFTGIPTSMSLDQIVHDAGYTPDNVQLVHRRCNLMKLDMGMDNFVSICSKIAQKHVDSYFLVEE